ncbi:MAG: histidine kinase [Acidobacteriota bacterium]
MRQELVIVAFAFLVALPVTALQAFYHPVDWHAYKSVVMVGLAYGLSYQAVLHVVLPAVLARMPKPWVAVEMIAGLLGVVSTIALGGWLNDSVMPLMDTSTEQHWWVGGTVVVVARLVELDHESLRRRVDAAELQRMRWRDQASRAELRALQAKVDPHFLFNSLNTVAGLIEEDARRAVAVVSRLAGLDRHTLNAGSATTVALADELEAAGAFLEMSALRFEDRLTYEIDAEEGLMHDRVPTSCLLPLVENAVLHGLASPAVESSERGARPRRALTITVRAAGAEGGLRLIVEDDGPGSGRSHHRGSGTALVDLRERLHHLSSGRARLQTGDRAPRGFVATIDWPIRHRLAADAGAD